MHSAFILIQPGSRPDACSQAMSIVTERMNANKPPPPSADPKSGRLTSGQINNNKDLDVELPKEEPSFFGTFFSGNKGGKKRSALTNGRAGSPVRYSSWILHFEMIG